MNSNADDTDKADLRGFSFTCGESFSSHELHEFSRIKHKLRLRESVLTGTK